MTILFDIYPAVGHFNASFVFANELLSRQHRIVYCVEPEYEKIITDRRFETKHIFHEGIK